MITITEQYPRPQENPTPVHQLRRFQLPSAYDPSQQVIPERWMRLIFQDHPVDICRPFHCCQLQRLMCEVFEAKTCNSEGSHSMPGVIVL